MYFPSQLWYSSAGFPSLRVSAFRLLLSPFFILLPKGQIGSFFNFLRVDRDSKSKWTFFLLRCIFSVLRETLAKIKEKAGLANNFFVHLFQKFAFLFFLLLYSGRDKSCVRIYLATSLVSVPASEAVWGHSTFRVHKRGIFRGTWSCPTIISLAILDVTFSRPLLCLQGLTR